MGKVRQFAKAKRSLRTRLFIVPHESGWAVKKPSSPSASKLYKTKREAEAAAREMIARRDGGEIVVHRRDGKITSVDTFTLGEGSFAKVSAVEGVALTREMHRDFRGLDKRRLSPEAGADG